MSTTAERKALQAEVATQGFSIRIDRWPARATYYKPDGIAMPGLPADPDHMRRYLRRGFTLTPPAHPEPTKVVPGTATVDTAAPQTLNQFAACDKCDFVAKSTFGLQAHSKRHQKENKP